MTSHSLITAGVRIPLLSTFGKVFPDLRLQELSFGNFYLATLMIVYDFHPGQFMIITNDQLFECTVLDTFNGLKPDAIFRMRMHINNI